MASKGDVYAALMRKGAYEVVQEQEGPTQLRLLGRSPKERWPFFSLMIDHLIMVADEQKPAWTCDVSKKYFRKDNALLYGWRFIFQAPALATQYEHITRTVLAAASPNRTEIESITLPGYKEGDVRGGVNSKGKGASVAGSLPLAVTRGGR